MNKKLVDLVHLEMVREKSLEYHTEITQREQLKELAVQCFKGSDRERGFICGLDAKGLPIYIEQVAVGSLNCMYLSMREIFRGLIMNCAHFCAFFHNHLSCGEISYSRADWNFTKQLKQASDLLGIELLDHLIINLDGECRSVLDAVLEEESFINE